MVSGSEQENSPRRHGEHREKSKGKKLASFDSGLAGLGGRTVARRRGKSQRSYGRSPTSQTGMLQQMQKLQDEMVKTQEALGEETVTVTAGGGMVGLGLLPGGRRWKPHSSCLHSNGGSRERDGTRYR